jgi:hypothetical protein
VDFTSRNDDIVTTTKVLLIEASDILQLPQGQAFALLEGNRRFKLRIPLADSTSDPFVPESLRKVAQQMKKRYRTSERWAQETDWLGLHPLGAAASGLIATDLATTDLLRDQEEDEAGMTVSAAHEDTSVLSQSAVLGNVLGHRA